MVAVKRNGGGDYDGLPYAHGPELGRKCASFSFGLPGRGWDKPGLNMFSSQVPPMSFYPSSSLSKRFESNVWIVRIVYVTAALSWIATSRFSISYQIAMERLSMDSVLLRNQMAHVSEEASTIEKLVIDERRVLSQLKKTSGALQHELRLVKAVETTTGGPIKPAPRSSNEKLIKGWLSSRKDSLVTKIYQLQRYLQADSRTSVVET